MGWFLSRVIYYIVSLFNLTYRYRYVGHDNVKKARKLGSSQGHLLGIWHQNLFHGILAQNGKHYVVIVSKSKDAEPVAYLCSRLGHVVARGSSRNKITGVDKGGKLAKEEMIEVLKTGVPGAVTIDGPKGPAREVKPGIIDMARQSGSPLVPYIPIPESYWTFNSWDKFRLPKPFSRIIVYYGNPIQVAPEMKESSFEAIQNQLKSELDEKEPEIFQQFSQWKDLSKSNAWE